MDHCTNKGTVHPEHYERKYFWCMFIKKPPNISFIPCVLYNRQVHKTTTKVKLLASKVIGLKRFSEAIIAQINRK